MKKSYFLLVFILVFSGCSAPIDSQLSVDKNTYSPIPVEPFIASTELPLPTVTPKLKDDPMNAVSLVLSNYSTLFTEDYNEISKNDAAGFSKIYDKHLDEDGKSYQFTAGNEETIFTMQQLSESFANTQSGANRAVLIKFMASKCNSVQFIFIGLSQHELRFDYGGNPVLGNETPFYGKYPYPFRLEENKWYYILIALDDDSNFRCEIWEDGTIEAMAYYACQFNDGGIVTNAETHNWNLSIMLEANEYVKLEQYWILDFEEYVK